MANWESLTHEERQAVYDAIQSELDASRDNLKDEPDNEVEREYAELLDGARHKLWPPEPDPAEPIDDLDWDNRCGGHPAGPDDPMGETVYCDGSCQS